MRGVAFCWNVLKAFERSVEVEGEEEVAVFEKREVAALRRRCSVSAGSVSGIGLRKVTIRSRVGSGRGV